MISSQFLETVNGTLLVVFGVILLLLIRYIGIEMRMLGIRLGYRYRRAAVGTFVLILGDVVIRGSVWFWRHFENRQIPMDHWKEVLTLITATGLVISIFGGICVIREFGPDRRPWRPWLWVGTTLAALAFGVGMAAF